MSGEATQDKTEKKSEPLIKKKAAIERKAKEFEDAGIAEFDKGTEVAAGIGNMRDAFLACKKYDCDKVDMIVIPALEMMYAKGFLPKLLLNIQQRFRMLGMARKESARIRAERVRNGDVINDAEINASLFKDALNLAYEQNADTGK